MGGSVFWGKPAPVSHASQQLRQEIVSQLEWCEHWIKSVFSKLPKGGGIETELFWGMAEKAGLWVRGTYDSPMSQALEKLATVDIVCHGDKFFYHVFRLA